MEEYLKGIEDLIYLVTCMVKDIKPDKDRVSSMDLDILYKAAEYHSLTAIAAYELETAGVKDHNFSQARDMSIRKSILMDVERGTILGEFEKNGIEYMPLKGIVLKEYYPAIGMRQMSDNDILYDVTKRDAVRAIMDQLGYEAVMHGKYYCHDTYLKKPFYNFEMHSRLFSQSSHLLSRYYERINEKMVKDIDNDFGYHMLPEDFYLYMIAHENKHYSKNGTGLRSLLDTYILLEKENLNLDYVMAEAEKMGIRDFEMTNRCLSLKLFNGNPLKADESEMLENIILAGTYGSVKNRIRMEMTGKNRWEYFKSRVILPYDSVKEKYTILKTFPFLYPFFCIYRLIWSFIFSRKVFVEQVKALFKRGSGDDS